MFLVFVDDILVAHSDRDGAVFQQVMQGLFDKYSMRQVDLTKNRFLGIRITQSLEEGYVFPGSGAVLVRERDPEHLQSFRRPHLQGPLQRFLASSLRL